MVSIKVCTTYFIILNVIVKIQGLEPLKIIDEINITPTERTIQNTVNDLFTSLKIQDISVKPKLKKLSTIHNFFASITFIDYNSLEQIAKISRVSTIDNRTLTFIAQTNEVLNGNDKSNEINDSNIYVLTYIQKCINKLKKLNELYVWKRNSVAYLKILRGGMNNETEKNKTSKSNQQLTEDNSLDDNEFWQPNSRRVYQGIRAGIKRFPFMASLHVLNKFQCAGAVINSDLILTSASCLQIAWNNRFFRENPAFLTVKVGCDYYDLCGDSIEVLEVYFHPSYNPKTLKHNLAIIRLRRKINFRKSHGRVKKIIFDTNDWPLPVNSRITIIGWGAKDPSNIIYDIFRNKLSYAELDYFPLAECQNHYSKEFVTDRNFCAGFYSKGGGACNRDAGGPGIVDTTLVGIISFGSPNCGASDAPTVFTKIGYYADWIEEIMAQKPFTHKAKTTTPRLPTTYILYVEPKTTQLKIEPFGDHTSTTSGPEVLNEEKEVLREQQFKNFLSNIFSSEEIDAYLDKSDKESKDVTRTGQIFNYNVNLIKSAVSGKYFPKSTTPLTKIYMDDIDEDKDSFERSGETTIGTLREITVLENASNDDISLDEDIVSLIDNLNIEQIPEPSKVLLSSVNKKDEIKQNKFGQMENYSSMKIITDSDKIDNQILKIEPSEYIKLENPIEIDIKKATLPENVPEKNEIKKAKSSKSKSVKNKAKYKVKKNKYVKNVTLSREAAIKYDSISEFQDLNKNSDYEEIGLSIETKPFINLTLRDRPQDINNKGILSETAMFDLISLAIEEQAQQLNKKKQRYLL